MAKSDPIDRALATFPKLYYYAPPLPKTLTVGGKKVNVKAPRDAILWLLEVLSDEVGQECCLNGDLQDLIQRCHPGLEPPGFTRYTNELKKAGLITKSYGANERDKQLSLTKRGREVLAAIKRDRREHVVKFLFEGLTSTEQNGLASALEQLARKMWPKIKEAIERPSKRKSRG